MSYLPFALFAYIFNGTAVLIDKFMITKAIPHPLVYTFYFSVFSALALFVLPFTKTPTTEVMFIASISTILWTTGAYFMFTALKIGQASRVIPTIGTLVPAILLLHAITARTISLPETFAILLLISGLIFLTAPDIRGKMEKKEIIFSVISAILFAISYLILKEAYNKESFLTVLIWSRLILIPFGIFILIAPPLRKIVFASKEKQPMFNPKSTLGIIFYFGQLIGGASELLITFSISLATPALVNSMQGIQYVFIFIASLMLSKKFPDVFKENRSLVSLLSKTGGIVLVAVGLYLLAFNVQG